MQRRRVALPGLLFAAALAPACVESGGGSSGGGDNGDAEATSQAAASG